MSEAALIDTAAPSGPRGPDGALTHLVGVSALVWQADALPQSSGDGVALLTGVEHGHLGDPGFLVHAGQQEPGLPPERVAVGEVVDRFTLAEPGHDLAVLEHGLL